MSVKNTPVFLALAMLSVLTGCGRKNNVPIRKVANADTVSTTQIPIPEVPSKKASEPFRLNGMDCFWETTDTVDGSTVNLIKLKDAKTRRVLLRHLDCCLKYGFDFKSEDHFKDVNFDGFEDFLIRSYGSTAENETTNVYLFDAAKKRFEFSEALTDNSVEVDSAKKILVTGSSGRDFDTTKHHRFDKSGKLKSTEIFTERLEYFEARHYRVRFTDYEKVVNGKTVATKRDSVVEPEE